VICVEARSDATKPTRGNEKYFVYDVALNLSPEFKVFNFAFPQTGKAAGGASSSSSSSASGGGGKGGGKARGRGSSDMARQLPKKILLSPNKRLLLMHGALHKGQNSLLVYAAAPSFLSFSLLISPAFDDAVTRFDADLSLSLFVCACACERAGTRSWRTHLRTSVSSSTT
jgi:hypothetical protein